MHDQVCSRKSKAGTWPAEAPKEGTRRSWGETEVGGPGARGTPGPQFPVAAWASQPDTMSTSLVTMVNREPGVPSTS